MVSAADFHQLGRSEAWADTGEDPGIVGDFAFEGCGALVLLGFELLPLSVGGEIAAYLEKSEVMRLYRGLQGSTGGEGNLVSGLFEGTRQGYQRVEVAVAAYGAE